MNWLIFILVLQFAAVQVVVEYRNEGDTGRDGKPVHWWSRPLSYYLSSVDGWQWQQVSYFGLAFAVALIAVRSGWFLALVLCLSAFGLVLVAVSRWPITPRTRFTEGVHKFGAGLAFVGVLVYEGIALYGSGAFWLPVLAGATAVAFMRWAPERSALEEKFFAAWLLAALVVLTGA